MKKIQFGVLLLMLLALFAAPVSALAAPATAPALDDVVVFGRDYTLPAGQTIEGALFVLGGSATIESGSTVTGDVVVFGGSVSTQGQVNGSTVIFGGSFTMGSTATSNNDVVVFGGNADLAGHVNGDAVILGGSVHLAATAVISGDLATPGGSASREAGSVVNGNQIDNFQFNFPRSTPFPNLPNVPDTTRLVTHMVSNGVASFAWLLFRSFALSTVALLLMLFVPAHIRRVAETVVKDPVASGGFGVVGFIVAVVATLGLAITLILIPVAIFVPFVLVAAIAFGWIAIGLEIGHRLADAFKGEWSPVVEAAVGTFALTFGIGLIHWVPCIGFLVGLVVGAAGLGAVVLTRFGTRVYAPATVSTPKALPAPRKKTSRTSKK